MIAKIPRKFQDFLVFSWEIFSLEFLAFLVDSDDFVFLDIAEKSQEFVGHLWILEKIPGKL